MVGGSRKRKAHCWRDWSPAYVTRTSPIGDDNFVWIYFVPGDFVAALGQVPLLYKLQVVVPHIMETWI